MDPTSRMRRGRSAWVLASGTVGGRALRALEPDGGEDGTRCTRAPGLRARTANGGTPRVVRPARPGVSRLRSDRVRCAPEGRCQPGLVGGGLHGARERHGARLVDAIAHQVGRPGRRSNRGVRDRAVVDPSVGTSEAARCRCGSPPHGLTPAAASGSREVGPGTECSGSVERLRAPSRAVETDRE